MGMKETRPAIVLDIDGCLADFNRPFAHELARFAPIDPHTVEFTQWHWYKKYNVSSSAVGKTWDKIIDDDQTFWLRLPVLPGVQGLINDCLNLGMDIHFVTARGTKLYDVTHAWLSQFIRNPRLCMTEHKGLYCAAVDAKYFLDDRPENCQNVIRLRGTETYPMLLNQPYNSDFHHPYIKRVNSLECVSEILHREQR